MDLFKDLVPPKDLIIWNAPSSQSRYPISGQKNYPSKRPQTVCFKESTENLADEKQKSRPCAGDMHMDISQEPFCMETYRESAKR